jgi:hypothetical protein
MLSNPDISPSESINCWIIAILTFHFELVPIVACIIINKTSTLVKEALCIMLRTFDNDQL